MSPSSTQRQLAQAALLGGALLLRSGIARATSPRLLVFLHLPMKQRALQTMLNAALPGIEVTTVGRIADLDRGLTSGQDAVLSLPVVLQAKGLKPRLQGRRGGASDESYALVGVSEAPQPSKVGVVGALDLLGRAGMRDFIRSTLGADPKVERVTKVEDLLPLLQMKRAEAILLPSRLVLAIRQMSRLNLAEQQLSKRVGLPAVSSTGPGAPAVLAALSRMDTNVLRTLGVDEWV